MSREVDLLEQQGALRACLTDISQRLAPLISQRGDIEEKLIRDRPEGEERDALLEADRSLQERIAALREEQRELRIEMSKLDRLR